MNPTSGTPDFKKARQLLEKLIYQAGTEDQARNAATRLLAMQLIVGSYGYFDVRIFLKLLSKINLKELKNNNPSLYYTFKEVKQYHSIEKTKFQLLTNIYQFSRNMCLNKSLTPKILAMGNPNNAAYYLSNIKCLYPNLLKNDRAKLIFSSHLKWIGQRDNDLQKEQGFLLWAQHKTSLDKLSNHQLSNLLLAKFVAVSSVITTQQLKFHPQLTQSQFNEIRHLQKQLTNGGDKDQIKALEKVDMILRKLRKSSQTRNFILYKFGSLGIYKGDYLHSLKFNQQLMSENKFSIAQKNYLLKMQMLFDLENSNLSGANKRYEKIIKINQLMVGD